MGASEMGQGKTSQKTPSSEHWLRPQPRSQTSATSIAFRYTVPKGGSCTNMGLLALSAIACAASSTQQWIGPSEATDWAILFKPSCDASGENCKKCVSVQFGHGDDIFIQDCDASSADQQWQFEFMDDTASLNSCGILHLKQHWDYCAVNTWAKAGSKLQLSFCNDTQSNGWLPGGDFQLQTTPYLSFQNGVDCLKPTCMDLPGGDTTNGKPLQVIYNDGDDGYCADGTDDVADAVGKHLQVWDCTWSPPNPSRAGLLGHRYWFNVTVSQCIFYDSTNYFKLTMAITFRHENAVDLCTVPRPAPSSTVPDYSRTFVDDGKQTTFCGGDYPTRGWNCWESTSSQFSNSNQQQWVGTAWSGNSTLRLFTTNFSVACGGSDCSTPGFSFRDGMAWRDSREAGYITKMPFIKGKEDPCSADASSKSLL
jgi:hypothetical protein